MQLMRWRVSLSMIHAAQPMFCTPAVWAAAIRRGGIRNRGSFGQRSMLCSRMHFAFGLSHTQYLAFYALWFLFPFFLVFLFFFPFLDPF